MQKMILLVACLFCTARGRRVQNPTGRLTGIKSTEGFEPVAQAVADRCIISQPLKSLSKFLLTFEPTAAFNPFGPRLRDPTRSSIRAPSIVMNQENPKTMLNNLCAQHQVERPVYHIDEEEGWGEDITYLASVTIGDKTFTGDYDPTIKGAHAKAAEEALKALGVEPPKPSGQKKEKLPKKYSEINAMHQRVVASLGISARYDEGQDENGESKCTLHWDTWDEEAEESKTESVEASGSSAKMAKALCHEEMLKSQGHLPDIDAQFEAEALAIKEDLDENKVSSAAQKACELMQRTSPETSGWILFLPQVVRAVLAEHDDMALAEVLKIASQGVSENGTPLELWEALLDEAAYSLRNYELSRTCLQQLKYFNLGEKNFPSRRELLYFQKYRFLMALEKHGSFLQGIQNYELDPSKFCSVPLVDVEATNSDMVTLLPRSDISNQGYGENVRSVKANDVLLAVPIEVVEDLPGEVKIGDEDWRRSTSWNHPEAWLGLVTSVRGDRYSDDEDEEVRYNVRRLSRFGSDADEPLAAGRQYRIFSVSMETPTDRALSAMRCLCRVRLPALSNNFEGQKAKYEFEDDIREVIVGGQNEALRVAMEPARMPPGAPAVNEILDQLAKTSPRFAAFTPTQHSAVRRALEQKFSLIQGPPGTGKTHVACAIIAAWKLAAGSGTERILAVADSNVAADNLFTRLESFGIEPVRIGQGKEIENYYTGDELWEAVQTAEVVIATCIGSGMEPLRKYARIFDRVILDECTQTCEPAALVALGRYARQAVLIGDQRQLAATVLDRDAKTSGLGVSMFERMVSANGLRPTLLTEQWRMHSSVAEFPNAAFYNNQLVNAIDDSEIEPVPGFPWPNPECRVCFVDTPGEEQKRGFSSYNMAEANAVADTLMHILEAGFPSEDVCILTPYLAQRDAIRNAIWERDQNVWVSIDTVDGYQGMERDLVIFSAARANMDRFIGFLTDPRRMNVMLTRARRGVIVFGNKDTLAAADSDSFMSESKWPDWLKWVQHKMSSISVAQLPPPLESKAAVEKRIDPNDGGSFTEQEFRDYYGDDFEEMWNKAAPADGSPPAPASAPAPAEETSDEEMSEEEMELASLA